jgi:hypothetical protein
MDTEHRALQIARDHLVQPSAATGFASLRRAVGQEGSSADAIRDLANRVGGLDALEHLDDAPIADEPFDWSAVPDSYQAFVGDVLATIDKTCDRWLDVEYRTIARRLLARVFVHDSKPLWRSKSPDRIAAGVVHAVLAGNGELDRRRGRFRAGDVAAWCGVSSAGDVARTLLSAASFERAFDDGDRSWRSYPTREVSLAAAALLHSWRRRELLAESASTIAAFEAHEARRARRRPLVDMGAGHVVVRSSRSRCPRLAGSLAFSITSSIGRRWSASPSTRLMRRRVRTTAGSTMSSGDARR